MARKYHPDLNPNNKESEKNSRKSMRLTKSNTVNRKKYDEYGENWHMQRSIEKAAKAAPRKWSTRRFWRFGGGGDYPIFLNLCLAVVLMVVVAEALNIKARTFNLNCTLI
jgi:curved DNA-binding protein